jgi:hypothetical protein
MLSASQIASRCSVLGLVSAYWSHVLYCLSVNSSVGSTQPVVLWWFLIHDWIDRLMSISLGRKPPRDSACWAGSLRNRKNYLSIRNSVLLFKASHPPNNGLCMFRLQVRCPYLCQDITGTSIRVSSHCQRCTLVRWWHAYLRGFGCSTLRRPHLGPCREYWLKFSWRVEPPISVTHQVP